MWNPKQAKLFDRTHINKYNIAWKKRKHIILPIVIMILLIGGEKQEKCVNEKKVERKIN